LAVVAGGLVLAEVAEQDAGVGEQVAVDPDQFAGLPEPLLAAAQERLRLTVELERVAQDAASCDLGVQVGEDNGCPLDVLDRLVNWYCLM
jgi:hypothetical protein